MNKIIIDNNNIVSKEITNVLVDGNTIIFSKDGDYGLEVINCNKLELNIIVNSNVEVKLFVFSVDNDMEAKISYTLLDGAKLFLFKFYNNINNSVIENIYLNGKNSEIRYGLSSIACGVEDYKMQIFHNNCFVKSDITCKCIGFDKSKVTFIIDSVLDKGNTDVIMNQDTKIICMGDVDAKIEPNMLIEEDDVVARHGSVIGRFSDEDVFYMMSRGILFEDANKLMVKGFLMSHLDVYANCQERILEIINKNIR